MKRQSRTAEDVLLFWRSFLTHVKGPLAGKPFVPDRWQVDDIIRPLFGTLGAGGLRQYRTAYVEIPRKNGKSTMAAAIALYLLLADQELGPEVISAAADRDQASIVFDIARAMVQNSAALQSRCKIYRKEIVVPASNGRYRSISADAYTKHGLNCHGIVFDEVHAQPARELWDVLTTSTGARLQPLTFAITTAGHDRESLCYELHCYARGVRDGSIKDPTFLPVIYGAGDEADWTAEETWKRANPGYGISVTKEYFAQAVTEAKALPSREQAFRRLHLNQWTESLTRWIPLDRWDACQGERPDLTGLPAHAALDLSSVKDLTALVACYPLPGEDAYWLEAFGWAPAGAVALRERANRHRYSHWVRSGHLFQTEGESVDYEAVRQQLMALGESGQLVDVAGDPWNAEQFLQQLASAGVNVVKFRQGYASLSGPTKDFESLVLAGKIRHSGHPVLRWCVANTVIRTDPAGNVRPDKGASGDKIDLAVAAIMAVARARLGQATAEADVGGVDFW